MSTQPPAPIWDDLPPEPVNTFEIAAREKKAHAIARWLQDECVRVAEAADEKTWASIAKLAKQNAPSAETKRRVIEILKGKP